MKVLSHALVEDPHAKLAEEFAYHNRWVVVVKWGEPEAGICVMGPYKNHVAAKFACTQNSDWLEQFAVPDYEDDNLVVVTDDITFTILACGEPILT